MPKDKIPNNIKNLVESNLAHEDASIVLSEIEDEIKLEYALPPLVDSGKTYGDWNMFSVDKDKANDFRPQSALSIDVIQQMLKSAPVRFALEMKRAQIVSVFRNQRSWKIDCIDEELRNVVRANLEQILPKMALDFSFSSLAYGVSFQELVWERIGTYELGLAENKNNKRYVVAKIPNSVNPATVKSILRNKAGHFDGFIQEPKWLTAKEIRINRDSSLIIPYEEKFRNLWGESILKPMYPIWYWYEVVLRAMVKYMERTGTPVAMVKAPARATIIKPGTKERVDGITWGMEIASNVARSNAVVIPSDKDDQGNALWELQYLSSTEKSQPFLDILELLTQMILRAGLSADRALSQSSGGVGSYSIGEVHKEATALHNELILTQWVHYLNTYFLPLYSLYNRGKNGPTITLETQGLDPTDRTNLNTLLGVSQQMESFKDIGYRIDWESLLTVNNIPLKSQEEADEHKKKVEEENLKKQENMLNVQSKFDSPSPTKQPDGSLKANMPNKPADPKKLVDDKKLEDQINLYNPNHDRRDGKFTTGGGGISGVSKTSYLSKVDDVPDNIKSEFSSADDFSKKQISTFTKLKGVVGSNMAGSGVESLGLLYGLPAAQIVGTIAVATISGASTDNKNTQASGAVIGVPTAVIGTEIAKHSAKKAAYAAITGVAKNSFLYSIPVVGPALKVAKVAKVAVTAIGLTGTTVAGIYYWDSVRTALTKVLPENLVDFYHSPSEFLITNGAEKTVEAIHDVYSEITKKFEYNDDNDSYAFYSMIYPTIIATAIGECDGLAFLVDAKYIANTVPGFNLIEGKAVLTKETADEFIIAWKNDTLPDINPSSSVDLRLEENDSQINLFNPYHDDLGQFSSSKGLSSGELASLNKSSKEWAENKSRITPGKVIKTTGKVMGLAGITGVVGIASIAAIGSLEHREISMTPTGMPEVDSETKEADLRRELQELTQGWPSYVSEKDFIDKNVMEARKLGFEMPENVQIMPGSVPAGTAALYDHENNTLIINPVYLEELKTGDPLSNHVVAHELMHSNQEVDGGGHNTDELDGSFNYNNYASILEGQNDLATLILEKNVYGNSMTQSDILEASKKYKDINTELSMIESIKNKPVSNESGIVVGTPTLISGGRRDSVSSIGYENESGVYSSLIIEHSKLTGKTPQQTLVEYHNDGFNIPKQHQMLMDLFPSEMESNGYYKKNIGGKVASVFGYDDVGVTRNFPSQREIESWMNNHGYINKQKALEQMLGK